MLDRNGAIKADSERIAAVLDGADVDAGVPGCPDWTLRALVLHVGEVQRFWAGCLADGNPAEPAAVDVGPPPPDDALAGWMRRSTDMLVAALDAVADDAPCWTWWGEPATAGAVGRHQVQEAAVHRWDAESAVGTPRPLEGAVADDGVAEFLEVMRAAAGLPAADSPVADSPVADSPADDSPADDVNPGGVVTLVATDTGGTWRARHGTVGRATVRATASDLVLLLYGRLTPAAFVVEGDAVVLQGFLASVGTG